MEKEVKQLLTEYDLIDREVTDVNTFDGAGDFAAINKAEGVAQSQGYSVGAMCRDMPIALAKNVGRVAKWMNIDRSEYPRIEGVLLSIEFRNGTVYFVTFK